MISQLKKLEGKAIVVKAVGRYPVKANTPVQHVAAYQNNGTDRGVTPAKFVEKAEADHGSEWSDAIDKGVQGYLDGDERPMRKAGERIAKDINEAVNRIDTHRLQHSMKSKFE